MLDAVDNPDILTLLFPPNKGFPMAQRVMLIDDMDQSEGAETVTFALNGKGYELDLSAKNRVKLDKALEPFIKVARASTSAPRTQRRSTGGGGGGERINYATPERYGQLHRGRVTEEEAAMVRDNLMGASQNREAQGHPPIDFNDPKEIKRYGLDKS